MGVAVGGEGLWEGRMAGAGGTGQELSLALPRGLPSGSVLGPPPPGSACYSLFIKTLRCRLTLFAQYLFRQP